MSVNTMMSSMIFGDAVATIGEAKDTLFAISKSEPTNQTSRARIATPLAELPAATTTIISLPLLPPPTLITLQRRKKSLPKKAEDFDREEDICIQKQDPPMRRIVKNKYSMKVFHHSCQDRVPIILECNAIVCDKY